MTHGQPISRPTTPRHICKRCGQRRAVARFSRGWAASPDHDLCQQCWRSMRDRTWALQQRSRGLGGVLGELEV